MLKAEQKREKIRKIKALYRQAVSYYKKNDLDRAVTIFNQILTLAPDNKPARGYLEKKIPARREYLRRKEEQRKKIEAKKKIAKQKRLQRKKELAERKKARYEALEAKRKKKEEQKIVRRKLLEEKKRALQLQKEKKKKIKKLYKEAFVYYKNNDFTKAEDIFKKILVLSPEEKKAKVYLEKKIPVRKEHLKFLEKRKSEKEAAKKAREEREAQKKRILEEKKKAAREKEIQKKEAKEKAKRKKVLKETTSDFIIVKPEKTPREVFEDANYLCSQEKYEDALPLYNYAYDIAKDKKLKKQILAAKKNAQAILKKKQKETERKARKKEKAE